MRLLHAAASNMSNAASPDPRAPSAWAVPSSNSDSGSASGEATKSARVTATLFHHAVTLASTMADHGFWGPAQVELARAWFLDLLDMQYELPQE